MKIIDTHVHMDSLERAALEFCYDVPARESFGEFWKNKKGTG